MNDWHGISTLIEQEIDNKSMGGAAITVIKDGKTVLNEGYGSDQADTIYRLFSMTKLSTSIVTFHLVEQGLLSLDDPVAKWIPEWENHQVFGADGSVRVCEVPITIQHLLNMTSGVPYPGDDTQGARRMAELEQGVFAATAAGQKLTTLDMCRLMAFVPGDFVPGTRWAYGASADLLGGILEVATGKTLDVLYEEVLYGPLGMTDTAFCIPANKANRASAWWDRNPVTQYVTRMERPVRTEQAAHYFCFPFDPTIDTVPPAFLAGGGGVQSTASDYARLLQMLLDEGTYTREDGSRVQILKPETVRYMRTAQLSDEVRATMAENGVGANVPGYSYSNLFRILVAPDEARVLGVDGHEGEYGWDGASGNFCLIDPKANLVAIFQMHCYQGGEPIFRRKLYRAIVAED